MSNVVRIAMPITKEFEGRKLAAYLCPAGKWTIGYGSTFYEDGTPVKKGDTITELRAETLLVHTLTLFENGVRSLVKSKCTDNQLAALVDFAFNVGRGNLAGSTLLKLVNANPNDPRIRAEFMKWNKARVNGVLTVLNGLTRRRKAQADLYFK